MVIIKPIQSNVSDDIPTPGLFFCVKVSWSIYRQFLIMDIFPFNSFWHHHIFLKFDIFYLDIRFLFLILYPSCIYLLFYAYLCLLGAVTCVFLANNLAIFCRGNTSGYIGVCNNDKINWFCIRAKLKTPLNLSPKLDWNVFCFFSNRKQNVSVWLESQ